MYRRLHKFLGIFLGVIIFISSLTGILLAWKKHADWLQPVTQQGASKDLGRWLSFEDMAIRAQAALDSVTQTSGNTIDRMEGRPKNGIVKVLFKNGYWEAQLDASTGKVFSVQRRHADWIEHVHDGTIISEVFKLVSMNVLGFGLLVMILSGFWLWYGPKRIRRQKENMS